MTEANRGNELLDSCIDVQNNCDDGRIGVVIQDDDRGIDITIQETRDRLYCIVGNEQHSLETSLDMDMVSKE